MQYIKFSLLFFLQSIEIDDLSEQTLPWKNLVHKFLIVDVAVQIPIESLIKQDELAFCRVEAIALH